MKGKEEGFGLKISVQFALSTFFNSLSTFLSPFLLNYHLPGSRDSPCECDQVEGSGGTEPEDLDPEQ